VNDVDAARPGTLYIVATPIGNLEDISLRALRILREVGLIAAEDTRHTRKLLTHHAIHTRLISLHEHNERARTPELIARLLAGETVAVVSDAGTPALSDPGAVLVSAVVEAGIPVVPIPGPSALLPALVVSGLPPVPVTFVGFLPPAPGDRRRAIEAARSFEHTVVLYESPHRLLATLRALHETWGNRRVAVARELTKIHEEVFRGRLSEAILHFSRTRPRGEFTLVVEGANARQAGAAAAAPLLPGEEILRARESAHTMLRSALAQGVAPFEAVRRAAQATGLRRNEVYRLWLAIKREAVK
jgi:16S rRNA (cytidine1402-2'-O)-methyltransferase